MFELVCYAIRADELQYAKCIGSGSKPGRIDFIIKETVSLVQNRPKVVSLEQVMNYTSGTGYLNNFKLSISQRWTLPI
jgi:hypothetical protein